MINLDTKFQLHIMITLLKLDIMLNRKIHE